MDLGNAVLSLTVDQSGITSGFAKAKGEAEKRGKDIQISLDKIGADLTRTGKLMSLAATAPIVAAFTMAIKGAADEEKSLALLENAIRGAGLEGSVSAGSIRTFAESLQGITTFTHESTEEAATLLVQLTRLDEEGLKAILPRIQNLATALGVDLQTAALQVGKFIDGATTSIGRYKVPVAEGATESERLAAAIAFMDTKFSGVAETAARTTSGGLAMLINSVRDLADSFGVILLPVVQKLTSWLSGIIEWFSGMDEGTRATILTIAALVAAIGPLLIIGGQLMTGISSLVTVIQGIGGVMSWVSAGPIGLIILAVAALAFGVYELIKNWDAVSAFFTDMWEKVKAAFGSAIDWIKGIMTEVGEWIGKNIGWIVLAINPLAGAAILIIQNWSEIETFFRNLWANITGFFQRALDRIKEITKEIYDNTIGRFGDLFNKLIGRSIVPELVDGILKEFKRMQMGVDDWVRLAMNSMINLFGAGFEAVGEMIVTGADAWEVLKEAAKDTIATVLEAIGKELIIWGAKALIPMIGLFNPAGALLAFAGAAAAFVAAGAIRALAGGGWITEPVIGVGLQTGTGYAIAEREPEYVTPERTSMTPAGANEKVPVHVVVNIGARTLFDIMTEGSRNRQFLTTARSVVP